MLKQLSNLGTSLSKDEQSRIVGSINVTMCCVGRNCIECTIARCRIRVSEGRGGKIVYPYCAPA